MKRLYSCFVVIIGILIAVDITAQNNKFIFGFNGGVNFSQLDGDNLKGFNKVGYELGIYGGYPIQNNFLIVNASYGTLGSKKKDERPSQIEGNFLAEIDYNFASILLAFSGRFGNNWEGTKNFRYFGGIKYNYLLDVNADLISSTINEETIDEDNFKKTYLSLRGGIGVFLYQKIAVDIIYEHGLQNLLQDPGNTSFSSIRPYQLGIVFSYYLD